MKKTNKPSFATRAKQLQKKYSRAAFDPYEKAELEREMDALIEEQEAFKQAMGIDAMPQQQMELDANQAMMEGGMEEPQMFDGGGWWDAAKKGLNAVGDAYKFIDSGAGVLPQELYDPEIGSIPFNMGMAPTPGKAVGSKAAAIPLAGSWARGRQLANLEVAREAKRAKQIESIMDELSKAPGALGKQYPTGVRNLGDLSGKVPTIPTNIPWKNIGYGTAGAGVIGAGMYGATKLPTSAGTTTNSNSTAVSNRSTTNPTAFNWNGGLDYSSFDRKAIDEVVPEVPVKPVVPSKSVTGNTKAGIKSVPNQAVPIIEPSVRSSINILPMQNIQGVVSGDMLGYTGPTIGTGSFAYEGKKSIPPLVTNKSVVDPKKMLEADKLIAKTSNTSNTEGTTNNQFLPSYIAAGTNILGNLGQMLMDKKPKNVNFARYIPEDINLYEQRLAAQREADLARSVGRTTARNLGMNAGQAMSNIVSSESDVSRNLSNALLQSRLQEETTNVGERNKAGQINAEIAMKESLTNRGLQDEWRERQRGYLAGAVQTIPDAIKDINQIKYQYEYLKQMGVSEENALKWLNQKYPNYEAELQQMTTKLKKE